MLPLFLSRAACRGQGILRLAMAGATRCPDCTDRQDERFNMAPFRERASERLSSGNLGHRRRLNSYATPRDAAPAVLQSRKTMPVELAKPARERPFAPASVLAAHPGLAPAGDNRVLSERGQPNLGPTPCVERACIAARRSIFPWSRPIFPVVSLPVGSKFGPAGTNIGYGA